MVHLLSLVAMRLVRLAILIASQLIVWKTGAIVLLSQWVL